MDTLVRLVRCDDDFSLSGQRSLCSAFRDELGNHLLVKTTGGLEPNAEMGDVQEAIHLNRLLSSRPTLDTLRFWYHRWDWGNQSKAVKTPGVRTTDEDDGEELDAESRACDRSWTMQAGYFSQDRCELQFTVKELARRMQQPITKTINSVTLPCSPGWGTSDVTTGVLGWTPLPLSHLATRTCLNAWRQ